MPANSGYLESLVKTSAFDADQKKALVAFVQAAFSTLSLGAPDTTATAAGNFRGGIVPFTTSGTSGAEVAIAHKLERKPALVFPVLDPNTKNATIQPLTITRAADATYVYVSSTTTNASGHLYVE